MIIGEYELSEQAGTLIVEWMKPTLPVEIKGIALGLLAALPFLFLFRAPIARFADRHLHIHGSPKTFGVVAPALSLLCGLLLLLAKEPSRMVYWGLGTQGVSIKTPKGNAALRWSNVDSAAYDTHTPEAGTLVLRSKEGASVWLALSWLEPNHQDKVIDFINRATDNRFKLEAVPETETENDALPSPTEFLTK